MENGILNILIIFLVVAVIWTVIKQVFKLTARIFSCGMIAILILAAIWVGLNYANLF